jgi:hypothetical protein
MNSGSLAERLALLLSFVEHRSFRKLRLPPRRLKWRLVLSVQSAAAKEVSVDRIPVGTDGD